GPVLGSTSTYLPAASKNQLFPPGSVKAAWKRSQSGSSSPSPSTGTAASSTGGSGEGLQRKLPPLWSKLNHGPSDDSEGLLNITTVGAGTDAPPTTTGAAAGPTTTVSWTWRASGLRPVMAGSPAAAAIAAFAVRATLAAIAATVAAGAAAAGASAETAMGRAAPFLRTGSSKMLVNRS